jgi:5-dehydro-2-deoxygluconokinase
MAICEADITADFIASARAVLVTGTHFSTDRVAAASFAAMKLARAHGRKVAFDIDYRPNLWALGGHADGESRFAESARVTAHLQTVLPHCDLIVGTEEEWHIAGGTTDTIAALQAARAITDATIVCKRGPLGCVVFEGTIGGWDNGVASPVREIEVFNVLGAGDGFMAGFLSGWLRDESAADCALYANICGALAVSRHGCAPSYPSQVELRHMIRTGSDHFALRKDSQLEQVHWATTRRRRHDRLLAFAFDHRSQFVELAEANGKSDADIDHFKMIALGAVTLSREKHDGVGLLVDDRLGRSALHAASDHDIWIGRPIEQSGVFPLAFEEGPDLGSRLAEWPANHCVKVLAPFRTDDSADLIAYHEAEIVRLADACRQTGHELLFEIVTGNLDRTAALLQILAVMQRFYDLGVAPDWWKLEPVDDVEFWTGAGDIVRANDPHLQGIIVLGKEMPDEQLARVLGVARGEPLVRGFAIGRTIFSDAAQQWFAGRIDDQTAQDMMWAVFERLIAAWDSAAIDR